jgi:hypothetical protein
MVITSQKKKIRNIRTRNFEQKDYIKCLGIYILISILLAWDYQIKYVNSKLAKNIGIINKLRHYVDLKTLKQLYYSLIYPYINYGLMSWGNTYTSKLTKLRSSQNKCIRNKFFTRKKKRM